MLTVWLLINYFLETFFIFLNISNFLNLILVKNINENRVLFDQHFNIWFVNTISTIERAFPHVSSFYGLPNRTIFFLSTIYMLIMFCPREGRVQEKYNYYIINYQYSESCRPKLNLTVNYFSANISTDEWFQGFKRSGSALLTLWS